MKIFWGKGDILCNTWASNKNKSTHKQTYKQLQMQYMYLFESLVDAEIGILCRQTILHF